MSKPTSLSAGASIGFVRDEWSIKSAVFYWHLLRTFGGGDLANGSREIDAKGISSAEADLTLMRAFAEFMRSQNLSPSEATVLMDATLGFIKSGGHSVALNYYVRAFWYDCGMPTIDIGHKLASSFMVTSISKEVLADVRAPFPAFLVNMPSGLLSIHDNLSNCPAAIHAVLIGRLPDTFGDMFWVFYAFTDTGISLWRYYKDLDIFITPGVKNRSPYGDLDFDLDDYDERASMLLGRFMISLMLYYTNYQEHVKPIGKGHACFNPHTNKRTSPEPVRRTFKVTGDIAHDFRHIVRDYAAGVSNKLTVQSYVGGYWRSQPHGPRNTLRRRQFIEPFWRGPEDAPIAQRKIIIPSKEEGDLPHKQGAT